MRESILTIPINELFETDGCPICNMRNTLEQRAVEYIMGAAMMEPDVRIETNKQGFCYQHFTQMLSCKNRLSLALMLQSHLDSMKKYIFEPKTSIFEPKNAKQKKVSVINNDCFVCAKIEWSMKRQLKTFFEMYTQEAEFRQKFANCDKLCLPHFDLLVELCQTNLDKKIQKDFIKTATAITQKQLTELEADVHHFCNMYDYRSNGKDWGNSKDSIERAIEFLTTRNPDQNKK